MPSPILTTDRYNLVLSGGYRAREYIVVCSTDIVFQALISATPAASVFAQVSFDTVTVGAYTDIAVGQVVLISHDTNIRHATRYRVRKAPTSSVLYINETSDAILDGDTVWVINSYDVTEKRRKGPNIDWDKPPAPIAPMIKSADADVPLDAAYVKLTSDATATFDLSVVMQCLTKDATEGTYQWTIPGATYLVGDATEPTIQIEVNTPYNEWARLDYEDSNGTPNYWVFTITAGDPYNPAHTFFRLCHEPVDPDADWQTGYNASVNYWDGITDLLDLTRIVVVVDEMYNDGAPDWSNIKFVGYFTEDASTIQGDETFGQLKDATINLSGFLSLAGTLEFSPIAVRHATSPATWDQIDTPTPARIAALVLMEYSTLLTVAPCDFGVIDDTYFTGDFDVAPTSLMDAAQATFDEITSLLTQNAGGGLVLERNANFLSADDRNDLPDVTPVAITLGEGMRFTLKHVHKRQVGSVTVGYAVFNTTTETRYFLTASAPANGAGEGQEHREIQSQLLAANSVTDDAKTEAAERAGNWLEWLNPADTLTIDLDDGFGFISPSAAQWYTFDIPASDWIRGLGIDDTTRWLCMSISSRLNPDGTRTAQGVFRRETIGGRAKIDVSVVPSVTQTELPILPVRAVMGAFPPAPSINYNSTEPTNKQKRKPFDGWMGAPIKQSEAGLAAQNQPEPGTANMSPPIRFNNPSNVTSTWITTLGEAYTIKLGGSGKLAENAWDFTHDFLAGMNGWTTYNNGFGNQSVYTAAGWEHGVAGAQARITITTDFSLYTTPLAVSSVRVNRSLPVTNGNTNQQNMYFPTYPGPSTFGGLEGTASSALTNAVYYPSSPISSLAFDLLSDFLTNGVAVPGAIESIVYRGSGTNPFTGAPGTLEEFGDAFYVWNQDDDGNPINIQLNPYGGLLLDNAAITVPPPFSPNHEYEIPFTGTGSVLLARFEDADHSDNQNVILYLNIKGPGVGS
jgi:hypothetical protein